MKKRRLNTLATAGLIFGMLPHAAIAEECRGETKVEQPSWGFKIYLDTCDNKKFQEQLEAGAGASALIGLLPGGQVPSGLTAGLLSLEVWQLKKADKGKGVIISKFVPGHKGTSITFNIKPQ